LAKDKVLQQTASKTANARITKRDPKLKSGPMQEKCSHKFHPNWAAAALGMAILCLLGWGNALLAQVEVAPRRIYFATKFQGDWIKLDEENVLGGDSVVIEKLRYYVSDVELLQDEQVVARALPQHRLVDIEFSESWIMRLESTGKGNTYNHLRFKLGIDSLTSVSGALGGDLDPTTGMYWAWQSGYVNFKLEGTTPQCPARNHRFHYHLGGYKSPYNALQIIDLPLQDTSQTQIVVRLPIEQLLPLLNYTQDYEIMSPNAKAMVLSRKIGGLFEIVK
jgi:hypothetical protein